MCQSRVFFARKSWLGAISNNGNWISDCGYFRTHSRLGAVLYANSTQTSNLLIIVVAHTWIIICFSSKTFCMGDCRRATSVSAYPEIVIHVSYKNKIYLSKIGINKLKNYECKDVLRCVLQ